MTPCENVNERLKNHTNMKAENKTRQKLWTNIQMQNFIMSFFGDFYRDYESTFERLIRVLLLQR
jgi:hypothetical protein